jgi:hypothetical protein
MNPDIVTIVRRALAEHQGRDLTDPLAAASAAASYEIALRNLLREIDASTCAECGTHSAYLSSVLTEDGWTDICPACNGRGVEGAEGREGGPEGSEDPGRLNGREAGA